MSVTNPGDELRSGSSRSLLNVEMYKGESRESAVALIYEENALNCYANSKDQYTLFPRDRSSIILYASAEESGVNQALSIHTIGDLTATVPLGISTSSRGDLLTFRVSGLDAFDPSYHVYLEDASSKLLHNLRRDSTYTFTNFTGNINEGRFYIRFTEGGTDIDNSTIDTGDFYVYSSDGRMHVYSESDMIEKIDVYNLQGQNIYTNDRVNNEYYSFDVSAHRHHAIIIKVQTRSGIETRKLMIR
jgi:hypothetical protein